eukprot:CAMPEP_0178941170 /NCGR_PEP_ID=MMETSP0789-20121207/1242_1 /TAXON_ID=3005 /ORGANISM="Rhizosolenia setigera, Strain CCMP 1694" /LENGTH=898 /DNA_ID=CAMNT_0020620343 /DNA_START=495 /DNA_END=3191 /DNA_ORIENTATION=+
MSSSIDLNKYKLVVAGKMSLLGNECNIGQLNLLTGQWNASECVQLNLYNSYSGGQVYYLLANQSVKVDHNYPYDVASINGFKDGDPHVTNGGGELIVVGAFDTTYRNSQVTYCSVGKWNGKSLSKVGEGLCNSALSKGMKITTAARANQDVFVAGSFHTQVWNGERHEFEKIFNIAHFNSADQVWLPLHVGQITCSWCIVTVLALAWDPVRNYLHVAGKFNAIDGRNIPAGLAIYDANTGNLVAHPGGGLSMLNSTQDGVATSIQLDEENGVLYVMGSFQRLTKYNTLCNSLAAYEINEQRWTCLADAAHTVLPSGGGNMLLTPYGLMIAGLTTNSTTWKNPDKPYTVALLSTKVTTNSTGDSNTTVSREFNWSWLPGFPGHNLPLHTLSNGYDQFKGTVFIGGDNFIAKWGYEDISSSKTKIYATLEDPPKPHKKDASTLVPVTRDLSNGVARGIIMSMSQLIPPQPKEEPEIPTSTLIGYTIVVYCIALGSVFGMFVAIMCNKNLNSAILSFMSGGNQFGGKGISLDTLTYSAVENTNVQEAYQRAMQNRSVEHPFLLSSIDPREIVLHRIIGEGTFGRVWSAQWRSSSVAVKEFVFAQAAVAGRSSFQKEIIDEIIGEAGMMSILRHPYVLQLYGCSLTAQAIWIVSELCSLGSLRQLLDNTERELSTELKLQIALHVAEGMTYLHTQDPPIIHRDLKSHNIFVHETTILTKRKKKPKASSLDNRQNITRDNNMNIINGRSLGMATESSIIAKIGDWGSARAALSGSRTMTHGVGTACWLAPEVIKYARSSKFSDVFSYGIVLWELATREEVYKGLETTQIIARVASDNLRPELPQNCPWKDIMVKCWDEDPQKRISFENIVVELNRILKQVKKKNGSEASWSTGSYQGSIPNLL